MLFSSQECETDIALSNKEIMLLHRYTLVTTVSFSKISSINTWSQLALLLDAYIRRGSISVRLYISDGGDIKTLPIRRTCLSRFKDRLLIAKYLVDALEKASDNSAVPS